MAERNANGHWLPGASANPGGRPKAVVSVRQKAQAASEQTIEFLIEVREGKHDAKVSERLTAANIILRIGGCYAGLDDPGMGDAAPNPYLGKKPADLIKLLGEREPA